MSKTKGQTFRYRFGNETKTFWYRSRICLFETRLFRFCPESALLDQIVMLSFDKTYSGTNSNVMVCGTFLERLWNVCSLTVLTLLFAESPIKADDIMSSLKKNISKDIILGFIQKEKHPKLKRYPMFSIFPVLASEQRRSLSSLAFLMRV
jgi:hypothetical protein